MSARLPASYCAETTRSWEQPSGWSSDWEVLHSRLIWPSRARQRHTGDVCRRLDGHLAKRSEPGVNLL
jgi:hypothetical protein